MAKRITSSRVKKWAVGSGIVGVPLAVLMIWFMVSLGAIDITGFSGDTICAGTENDPCYAYINFTVNEDIFIYPSENWSSTAFYTDIQPKSVKMFRSWGNSWREIKLNQSCTGTWCGLSNSKDTRKFSFAFREGRNYQIKYEVLKEDPNSDIKWGFADIDPTFYGKDKYKTYDKKEKKVTLRDKNFKNISEVKLDSALDVLVPRGYNQIAEYTKKINGTEETIGLFTEVKKGDKAEWIPTFNFDNVKGDLSIESFELIDLKTNKNFNRTIDVKIKKIRQISKPTYATQCVEILNETYHSNGTMTCSKIVVGSHFEDEVYWEKINLTQSPGIKIKIKEWAIWSEGLNAGLVSYWKMDDESGVVLDSVGTGVNNLTNTGTAANTTGKIVYGYDFDGTNDYLTNGGTISAVSDLKTYSINMWVNPDDIVNQNMIVGSAHESVDRLAIGFVQSGIHARSYTPDIQINATYTPGIGVWAMVTYIHYSNDTHLLFVNNVSVTGVGDVASTQTTADFVLGASNNPTVYRFNGKMDEASVWNRSLTSSEMNDLYNNGAGISYTTDFVDSIPPTFDEFPENISIDYGTSFSQEINGSDETEFDGYGINWTDKYSIGYVSGVLTNTSELKAGIDLINITINDTAGNINSSMMRVEVNKSDEILYILMNETSPIEYGTTFNLFSNASTAFTLYLNDSLKSNNSAHNLAANTYNITAIRTDQENYSSVYDEETIVVQDTVSPIIGFVTPSINNTVTDKNYIPVEVDINETNPKNVTYIIANDTGIWNTTTYLMATDSSNVTINWTGLAEGVYIVNVSTSDQVANIASTAKRYITYATFSLHINFIEGDEIAELGSLINITANTTISSVDLCLSINHSAWGTNYTCNTGTVTLNFTPTNFRKTNFSILNKDNYNIYFDDVPMTYNFTVSSHQYDEPDNLFVNITGTNNPKDILFHNLNNTAVNLSNSTERIQSIDRYFPGKLNGSLIWLDHDYTYTNTSINISYFTAGESTLYFLLDDIINGYHNNIYRFFLNLTGFSQGTEYTNGSITEPIGFSNFGSIDESQTDCQLDLSGVILAKNVTEDWYYYDDFADNIVNQTRWTNTTYDAAGSQQSYVIETGGNLKVHTNDYGIVGTPTATATSNLLDKINSDTINTSLTANYLGVFGADHPRGDVRVSFGGVEIFDNYDIQTTPGGGTESGTIDLDFEFTKVNHTSWNARIWGWDNASATGTATRNSFYNGNLTIVTIINNNLTFLSSSSDGGDGSTTAATTVLIPEVNRSLWTRENCTVISNSIYDASGDILQATITAWENGTATEESRTYYLSADNGDNWEATGGASGTTHVFSNTGRNLRWRADMNITGTDDFNVTEGIIKFNASIPAGNITNLSIDWGGDGTWEYNLSGQLNNTNVNTIANLSFINLSAAFVEANKYLTGYAPHTYIIPLVISSDSLGNLQVDGINLTYNPNPISLNVSHNLTNILSNSTNFSIFKIPMSGDNSSTGLNGSVLVDDLKYDYAGGNNTISIIAHFGDLTGNITRFISYYYSRWDYNFIPSAVDYIFFGPQTPTDQNVTPHGQTSLAPILNITSLNYNDLNSTLSIYLNGTISCVNTTLSQTINKTDGFFINESWQNITTLNYLEYTNVSLWADYNCSYSDWYIYNPQLYFRQCIHGGLCVTELT